MLVRYDGIDFDSDDEFNSYLLYKYLLRGCRLNGASPEDAAAAAEHMITQNSKNLFGYHGLAWSLGRLDLEFFNLYFLQNVFIGPGKAEISADHKTAWMQLQSLISSGKPGRMLYIKYRGWGKTTFISQSSAIWAAVYGQKRYIILCSAVGDTADAFVNNIKLALKENARIEKAFGKLYDPQHYTCNNEIIDLANSVRIQSISSASVFRGKNFANVRPELVILDDYQKDDDVATPEQRDKKWKRFQDDVMKSVQQNSCVMIACGTIQHKDDFYDRLLHDPTWPHSVTIAIPVKDVDRLFDSGRWGEFKKRIYDAKDPDRLETARGYYYDHENEMQYPLQWSQWFNCLDVALSYYSNPVSFKQEMQCDVDHIGMRRFTTIITEPPKVIEAHDFQQTMLCIDPASSTGKENDYTAFLVGSRGPTGVKYVRKGEISRLNFDAYIAHAVALLKRYDEITHIYIEKNLYMGTDVLRLKEWIQRDPQLCSRPFIFQNDMQKKNKVDKIDAITGDVLMGRLIFNAADTEALQQLADYQGAQSLHDDFPDIVAEFDTRIGQIQPVLPAVGFYPRRLLF
jgi:hypothetical protein